MNWKQIGWAFVTWLTFFGAIVIGNWAAFGHGVLDVFVWQFTFSIFAFVALVFTAAVWAAPFIKEWGIGSEGKQR